MAIFATTEKDRVDVALLIDNDVSRIRADVEFTDDVRGGGDDLVFERQFLEKGPEWRLAVPGKRDEHDIVLVEFIHQLVETGDLDSAGCAPDEPEIQHDHLATEGPQVEVFSIE